MFRFNSYLECRVLLGCEVLRVEDACQLRARQLMTSLLQGMSSNCVVLYARRLPSFF